MDRHEREAKLVSRISELRAKAEALQAQSDRVGANINRDHAFWTQPAYSNAGGRSFARARERERAKIVKSFSLAEEAKAIREKADSMESRGVVMAGDANAKREAKIANTSVQVGQMVHTTHYGLRKVLKVNAKSVSVEGAFGPLKISKEFISGSAA